MEKMIREAVEKQISIDRQTIIQAVHSDVARQVGERIADSVELRSALETMAKTFFQEQTELSRNAGTKVEQELSSRATAIIQSFEESFAEMETRINAARADMEVAQSRTQSLKQEIEDGMRALQEAWRQLNNAERAGMESFEKQATARLNACGTEFENQLTKISAVRATQFTQEMEVALTKAQTLKREIEDGVRPLQETLQQLNDAEKAGMDRFQRHATAQLNIEVAQFEEQLTRISVERAVQFAMEMEERLAPHRRVADETVEKLGAVLQLVQGTARVQQERITEHSRTTAANFEKEIRALLLRLAEGAEH
jgi:predicted  nucleic acid-binding Zn-ribbon protein